jgi:transcriptional regulator with XRE-family HTH domain
MPVKDFCTPSRMYAQIRQLHPMYMAKRVVSRLKGQPKFRRTFIRQWREHRGLTLEALADRVGQAVGGFTHASLSRIERGKQPYSQPILEALAHALQTDVASLLMRDPSDPEAIWSIWDEAKEGERREIVGYAKGVVRRTG